MGRVKKRAAPDPGACLADAWAGLFELPLPLGSRAGSRQRRKVTVREHFKCSWRDSRQRESKTC